MHDQVQRARELSLKRWGGPPGRIEASEIQLILDENPRWSAWLETLHAPSLRSRHKLVRVALSFSCWDETDAPHEAHFMEASCYRPERQGLMD
jgi:hypothetical protein